MEENERFREFFDGFNKLSEENKKYVLAISQALLFSQTTSEEAPEIAEKKKEKSNNL